MRAALSIPLLALAISVGATAHAQTASEPTPAQVRAAAEAFDRGREAYKAEEFVEAAEQFERADGNAPSSAALELAIRARDKAGELDRAATLLALALKRHPTDDNLQKLSVDLLKRARDKLFELNTTCDVPCDVTVGGKLIHGAPDTQRTIYVQPGALTVRAGWSDNRNDSKQIQAEAGAQGEARFVAPTAPAAQGLASETTTDAPELAGPADGERDGGATGKAAGWSPVVFFVGAGITAVLGGVTVWSGIDTINNPGADRVKTECATQGEACELYQEGLSKQRRTNVLIGVTAGAGVATILVGVLATDWTGGKTRVESAARLKPGMNVSPWASLDGGGLQAVGRF
jgi:tetratricopeptide (TPR) repeat protein